MAGAWKWSSLSLVVMERLKQRASIMALTAFQRCPRRSISPAIPAYRGLAGACRNWCKLLESWHVRPARAAVARTPQPRSFSKQPSRSGDFAADAAEADVAHAGVHHLRMSRRGTVAPGVGGRAEERAAFHHFPRDADGGLGGIEGAFHRRAARLRRGAAAGLGQSGSRMTRGPPVHRPLPDIPAHLEQSMAIRGVAPDGTG